MHPSDENGQSLVELALALPLLLVIVLGLGDLGRAFYYSSVIANAAREGASYASAHASTATAAEIASHVCNETGFVAYSPAADCPGLAVSATYGGGADAVVTVTYDFDFLSAYLVNRIFAVPALRLHASATFPAVGE